MNLTKEELAKANIYQQCVEDIKAFYKENKFAYEAQKLGEELDEFLEKHFYRRNNNEI